MSIQLVVIFAALLALCSGSPTVSVSEAAENTSASTQTSLTQTSEPSGSPTTSVSEAPEINNTSPAIILPPGGRIQAVFFRDDFNSFLSSNWKREVSMFGGFNWEFQVYTNEPKNVFTKDGYLYLQPTLTVDDPRFDEDSLYSGKMDMNELFGTCTQPGNYGCTREGKHMILPTVMSGKVMSVPTIRYGIVEIRARIPQGDWLWPAMWMLPKNSKYGIWPRSGEIDIMESRGNEGPIGVEKVSSTLHWGPNPAQNQYSRTSRSREASNWADEFHTWRLEWTPDHIITFVDDKEIMRASPNFWKKGGFNGSDIWADGEKMAPFDEEFFLIFNVAVGGNNGYFPDGNFYNGTKKPWINWTSYASIDFWNARKDWLKTWKGDKTAMIIDYVEFRHL